MKINEGKRYIVYKYTSPSNKVYIGQTCRSLDRRAYEGKGYVHSTHFYSAILKYGFKNFKRDILKDNLTLKEANYWEEYYIKYYNSTDREKGYNIQFGGDNRKVSEETKLKIRKYMAGNNPMKNPEVVKKVAQKNTGRHYSEESNKRKSEAHKKRILCVELDKIYNSRNEAAKEVGVDASNISRAAKGETQTSGGYHWRYV